MENTIYEYFRKIVHYQRNMQREYLEVQVFTTGNLEY